MFTCCGRFFPATIDELLLADIERVLTRCTMAAVDLDAFWDAVGVLPHAAIISPRLINSTTLTFPCTSTYLVSVCQIVLQKKNGLVGCLLQKL